MLGLRCQEPGMDSRGMEAIRHWYKGVRCLECFFWIGVHASTPNSHESVQVPDTATYCFDTLHVCILDVALFCLWYVAEAG